jgi:hypothetical protein
LIFACTVALGLLGEPAYPQQTPIPEPSPAGVRLAIALTNNVLIAGSNTLLSCWLTNNSAGGLSLEQVGALENVPESYCFQIWLKGGDGKEYPLTRDTTSGAVSRRAERIKRGEVRSYRLFLPIAAEIPPGRYQLRLKRALHGPGTEVLSNILEVQVKAAEPTEPAHPQQSGAITNGYQP